MWPLAAPAGCSSVPGASPLGVGGPIAGLAEGHALRRRSAPKATLGWISRSRMPPALGHGCGHAVLFPPRLFQGRGVSFGRVMTKLHSGKIRRGNRVLPGDAAYEGHPVPRSAHTRLAEGAGVDPPPSLSSRPGKASATVHSNTSSCRRFSFLHGACVVFKHMRQHLVPPCHRWRNEAS